MKGIEAVNIANRYFAVANALLVRYKVQHVVRAEYSIRVGADVKPKMGIVLEDTISGNAAQEQLNIDFVFGMPDDIRFIEHITRGLLRNIRGKNFIDWDEVRTKEEADETDTD